MSRLLTLMVLLLVAPSAWAAEQTKPVTHMSISLEDCQRLLQNDVRFKPGVDVNGRTVVPAEGDFPKNAIKAPDEIVIDFGLDLAGRYGIGSAGFYKVTAGILTVHFDPDTGKLTFNGKPLVRADAKAVTAACQELESVKKPQSNAR